MRSGIVVVLVTCPSWAVARRLAQALVRRRLAACVNILPGVESLFWWEGKVDQAREVLLVIKTPAARLEAVRRAIVRLHPYEVPEVIAMRVAGGHRPYLRWVAASARVSGRHASR